MLSGLMPPTGSSSVSFGTTARQAFTTIGGRFSAGNILSPAAPHFSAAKASVGVATPGVQASPAATARAITAASPCGMTTSRPPASRTRSTSAGSSTVPAPLDPVWQTAYITRNHGYLVYDTLFGT